MTRRALLRALCAGALIAGTWPASGQQQMRIPRIGMLYFAASNDSFRQANTGMFRQRLAELGYVVR